MMNAETILESTITCPECGHRETETMPTDYCLVVHDCGGCGRVLRPLAGDCCVFCSYGDVPCPPVQEAQVEGRMKRKMLALKRLFEAGASSVVIADGRVANPLSSALAGAGTTIE